MAGRMVKKITQQNSANCQTKIENAVNNSQSITDLKVPPSNKLEKLKGDLKDFYSIRINDQWRIIFNGIMEMHLRLK